jgi:hypothetical protein
MGPRCIYALFGLLLLASTAWAGPRPDRTTAINAVIGDASWTAGSAVEADEQLRIRTHLRFVLGRLRSRDVSALDADQLRNRGESLRTLEHYIARGEFPRRTGDEYVGRRPRFIDDRGVHCAVGQLIADSGREDLARAIDRDFEYAYVEDMRSPALAAWARTQGFTLEELATIQPSYSALPTPEGTKRKLLAGKDAITIESARQAPPLATIALHVKGDDRGDATSTTATKGAFAACFAEHASRVENGGGAYMGSPAPYAFDVTLELTPPQTLFERAVEQLEQPWGCTPRPGAIPREFTIDARTSTEGLVVDVSTEPSNPEVDACLKEGVTGRLRGFGAGAWELHAKRTRKARSHMFDEQLRIYLEGYGQQHAHECYPDQNAPKTLEITGSAKPDDAEVTLRLVGGDAAFRTCVRNKIQASLRDSFTVYRKLPDGKGERYFRIDASMKAKVKVQVKSPARVEAEQKALEEEMRRRRRPDL